MDVSEVSVRSTPRPMSILGLILLNYVMLIPRNHLHNYQQFSHNLLSKPISVYIWAHGCDEGETSIIHANTRGWHRLSLCHQHHSPSHCQSNQIQYLIKKNVSSSSFSVTIPSGSTWWWDNFDLHFCLFRCPSAFKRRFVNKLIWSFHHNLPPILIFLWPN